MSTIITASIDLSKVHPSKIYEKDGKKYLSLNISVNDEVNQWGNNVSISVGQTKEERENKEPKSYLGNGKVIWTDGKVTKVDFQEKQHKDASGNDMPF